MTVLLELDARELIEEVSGTDITPADPSPFPNPAGLVGTIPEGTLLTPATVVAPGATIVPLPLSIATPPWLTTTSGTVMEVPGMMVEVGYFSVI